MDKLPRELLTAIIPDPDTLMSMLFVCKWTNATLVDTGQFTLTDGCGNMVISNMLLSFSLESSGEWLVCSKECVVGGNSYQLNTSQFHDKFGTPTILRGGINVLLYASNVGWDFVRYKNKYKIHSVVLRQVNNSFSFLPSGYFCNDYVVLYHGTGWYAVGVSETDIKAVSDAFIGSHIIYKKITY